MSDSNLDTGRHGQFVRRCILTAITSIENTIAAQVSMENICTVKYNVERLNTEYESYRNICMQFESDKADVAAAKAHNAAVEADFELIISKVSAANGKARAYIAEYEAEKANNSMNMSFGGSFQSGVPQEAAVKLPRIDVPKFDGKIENFLEFWELFKSLVHEEATVPKVRKLHYLKEALKDGEAADLMTDIPLTEKGYDEAWTLLISNFKDIKSIIRKHLDNIFSLKRIKSSGDIPNFLLKVNRFRKGIKACGEEPDNFYLSYIVSEKLDKATFDEFERTLPSNDEFPSWEQLCKFLEKRAYVSKRASDKVDQDDKRNKASTSKADKKASLAVATPQSPKSTCPCCNQNPHLLINCEKFVAKAANARFQFIKEKNLCINCFGTHKVKLCNKAPNCKKCNHKHHTFLHFEEKSDAEPPPPPNGDGTPKGNSGSASHVRVISNISSEREESAILPTAVLKFKCSERNGEFRVLLDSGSQVNLVSNSFVKRFNLPTHKSRSCISGVGNAETKSSYMLKLTMFSRSNKAEFDASFSVIDKLPYSCNRVIGDLCGELCKFPLADPAFYRKEVNIPGVDALFGIELYNYIVGNLSYNIASICIRESKVGWIVSSTHPNDPISFPSSKKPLKSSCNLTVSQVESQMKRFWEIENIPTPSLRSKEDEAFLKHFDETTKRGSDGKFIVELPFTQDPKIITGNFKKAYRVSCSMERRLKPENRTLYAAFMDDYEQKGHLSVISETNDDDDRYYITHHAVYRPSSTTTPLRAVFNASAKSVNNISLNDILMIGPVLQPPLAENLLLFRTRLFAMTADIAQMYRNAWVAKAHRKFLSIIWNGIRRELNTITYGTASAAAQATKLLEVIAEECKLSHPLAYEPIKRHFYMDDLLSGADSVEELINLQKQVHEALLGYGFELRKYQSNSPEVLKSINAEFVERNVEVNFGQQEALSVLGLGWNSTTDILHLKTNFSVPDKVPTKRQMYSTIMRIFDPLGIASPVTIRGKIMLQTLWKRGISWDEPVPEDILAEYQAYLLDLQALSKFEIPRYILNFDIRFESIVGFCDASERAYCAAVYAFNDHSPPTRVQLLISKTRVAPLDSDSRTIPELELQAALQLVELVEYVCRVLKVEKSTVRLFTDSTIVLAWLSRPANDWKVFVRNRVAKITKAFPIDHWSHVVSKENPADLATRGLTTNSLIESRLWQHGPEFIAEPNSTMSKPEIDQSQCTPYLSKSKAVVLTVAERTGYSKLIEAYPSYHQLVRVFATGLAIAETWRPHTPIVIRKVEAKDLQRAHELLILAVQDVVYAPELDRLRAGRKLCKRSSLLTYYPFIDEKGLLRSRTRLQNARKPFNEKCPIILPANNHFTVIFVRHLHERYFHANRAWLLAHLSANYVFTGGMARLIKTVIHKCVTCCRYIATSRPQLMADLPADRVTPMSPFLVVGVDFTGAFHLKCTYHRTMKEMKAYAAIFVCFATRAVHIEVVPSLSTEDFLNSFKNFISRRGKPVRIYSDNGTNFKGAERYLSLQAESISKYAAEQNIEWRFNPPYTPHRGGLWESAVKSAKKALAMVTKDQKLSEYELRTLLTQVECILNSRPIAYKQTNEPQEEVLTPGHFLIGRNLTVVHEAEVPSTIKLSSQYTANKQRLAHLWRIWSQDYINQLRCRTKWTDSQPNLEVGQIVLLPDSGVNPCRWPLAKVVRTFPDKNNVVRTVETLSNGQLKTIPSIQTILLPIE